MSSNMARTKEASMEFKKRRCLSFVQPKLLDDIKHLLPFPLLLLLLLLLPASIIPRPETACLVLLLRAWLVTAIVEEGYALMGVMREFVMVFIEGKGWHLFCQNSFNLSSWIRRATFTLFHSLTSTRSLIFSLVNKYI